MTLTLYTFDWLPEFPRGFVRDLRVRWGLEEIGRSYQVATVPAHPKSAEHRKLQPFTQVPVIQDGEQTLFESGAILVYLCEGTPLLPDDRKAEIWQWLFAALNTVELSVMHWVSMILAERVPEFFGPPPAADVTAHAKADMDTKLTALQQALGDKGSNFVKTIDDQIGGYVRGLRRGSQVDFDALQLAMFMNQTANLEKKLDIFNNFLSNL